MADITHAEYIEGSSLPDLWVSWRDATGKLLPFASQPHTFEMRIANRRTPSVLAFTKTVGFQGFNSDPNLDIGWVPGSDLSTLAPGLYDGVIIGTRQADNRPRQMEFTLRIVRRPGSAVDAGAANPPE